MKQKKAKRSRVTFLMEAAAALALGALVAFLFFSSYTAQDSAMDPTIQAGNHFFINKTAYTLSGVSRGDVIAYKSTDSADDTLHVRRVIGLPGETIQIRNGLILIDGKTYMESREFPEITKAGIAENPVTIGDAEYFVLGDNRNNSEDSRFADVGNVTAAQIVGKVWFIEGPSSNRGFVR